MNTSVTNNKTKTIKIEQNFKLGKLYKYIIRDKYLLVLTLPVIVYYIIFHYIPMYGAVIAFKNFTPTKGILGSEWVGFKWFLEFFNSMYFTRIVRNTLLLSTYSLLWGFPVPIIFAMLLNEVKNDVFKRSIQTISYLPHFITIVIIVGLMSNLLSPTDGLVNIFIKRMGGQVKDFMTQPSWFRTIYIGSGIWQSFGWNSIIYLASLAAIDPSLYEASLIEGANRWQQMRYITFPGIMPTAIMLLILSLGSIMSVGFEKIILMYNPLNMETADVISTFVYRRGIIDSRFAFGAAVGLFNSAINLVLLIAANRLSRKITEISLW
jgi:putative aldouronate transport system permease protein